jgi:hypothetical protein
MVTTQTATDWRKEWFEIEDATYLNTAAHAAIPRVALRAVHPLSLFTDPIPLPRLAARSSQNCTAEQWRKRYPLAAI